MNLFQEIYSEFSSNENRPSKIVKYLERFAFQEVEGVGFYHREFASHFHENFVVQGLNLDLERLHRLLQAAD